MKSRGFILVKTATPIETAPVGGVATEMFLNSAVIILARIEPAEMMRELLAIEHQMGRSRQEAQISPGANRIIDLDILMVKILGGQRDIMLMVDQPDLQIPHARMIDRGFVLQPAAEIAPDWVHPRSGRRIADLWKQLKV